MIRKLKLRFTILVWTTLLIVMVGVVVAINLTQWNRTVTQANAALEMLCSQNGERPSIEPSQAENVGVGNEQVNNTPPPVDQNGAAIENTGNDAPQQNHSGNEPGSQNPAIQPGAQNPANQFGGDSANFMRDAGQASASLSNYYTVKLDHDGNIDSWSSDRSDLYSDDEVTYFVEQVAVSGKTTGQIGNCFYKLQDEPYGSLLIVLDKRLEISNAQSLLMYTILIGLGSWILMGIGAYNLIRRLVQPVQEAFERQQQFVWDASHELKTPLAVISANADVLSRDIGENEWLGYIHDEIDRAARMINSMLTLAQIDQGAVKAQMKSFDLSSAMTGVLLPFESVAFENGKTLVLDVPDGIRCTGDESMITQLLTILLSNAIKYANDGGTVTVQLKSAGRHCIIAVYNTGEGISPRDREHIFERFYRVNASHNSEIEGSGLGLAIAKSLVDAHNGHITVDCPQEGGTRFTVTLP